MVARMLGMAGAVMLAALSQAGAVPVTYGNPFADYGQVPNTACGAVKGICGAVAAENSFIFLSNYYPGVYGGTKLATGNEVGPNANANAAADFGVNGWTANGHNYQGYYPRPGTATGDFIDTLTDWVKSFAPGTSSLESMFAGNGGAGKNGSPDFSFLRGQMRDHEDVELFIKPATGTGSHVLTLVGVTVQDASKGCDVPKNCSLTYQDPNDPTTTHMADLTLSGGVLGFKDTVTYNQNVTITAAFAQSPIPEPATGLLLMAGLGGLLVARRRRV